MMGRRPARIRRFCPPGTEPIAGCESLESRRLLAAATADVENFTVIEATGPEGSDLPWADMPQEIVSGFPDFEQGLSECTAGIELVGGEPTDTELTGDEPTDTEQGPGELTVTELKDTELADTQLPDTELWVMAGGDASFVEPELVVCWLPEDSWEPTADYDSLEFREMLAADSTDAETFTEIEVSGPAECDLDWADMPQESAFGLADFEQDQSGELAGTDQPGIDPDIPQPEVYPVESSTWRSDWEDFKQPDSDIWVMVASDPVREMVEIPEASFAFRGEVPLIQQRALVLPVATVADAVPQSFVQVEPGPMAAVTSNRWTGGLMFANTLDAAVIDVGSRLAVASADSDSLASSYRLPPTAAEKMNQAQVRSRGTDSWGGSFVAKPSVRRSGDVRRVRVKKSQPPQQPPVEFVPAETVVEAVPNKAQSMASESVDAAAVAVQ